LALENETVQESAKPYIENLSSLVDRSNDVIGFVFAINDDLKSADVYSSNTMFRRLWPRLLKAATVEAIAEAPMKTTSNALPIDNVGVFLVNAETGAETVSHVTTRTHSAKRETEKALFFETRDMDHGGAWIHRNYLTKKQ
ncbi:MAG TPA: DUF6569 family protein, partial [Pyrinomonadaceae bacterium]|nr:DUF6569 family protein [Pyrinomonadaceae bacterium]